MLAFLLLGLIQGLTEFLPISSSGHLALTEIWLQTEKPGLLFDALVHAGTVASVLIFYRKRIAMLIKHPFSQESLRLLRYLLVAMLPIVVLGFSLRKSVEVAFETPVAVAGALLWTGLVLFLSRWFVKGNQRFETLSVWQLLIIGFAQALAIFPGVSRSGMTIVAALWVGLSREKAAEFSFFLAIPAILGATALQAFEALGDWEMHLSLWPSYLGGTLIALLAGIAAIGMLIRTLQRGRLHYFAYYCWVLGASVLIWFWLNKGG